MKLTEEQLRRRAMVLGARLETEDGAFNAARAKGPAPARKPKQAPAAPQTLAATDRAAVEAVERANANALLLHEDSIRRFEFLQAAVEAMPADKPTVAWDFKVVRDAQGRITNIKATATRG